MADKEQLAVIQKGVEAWNEWRKDNRGERVDFIEADRSRVSLSGADLHETDLSETLLY
ncbi:MAG: pentapeptide repeat-containing protein [Chloroflexota bacterium]